MTRRIKEPLRPLTIEERAQLEKFARSLSEPAWHVLRAKALLAVNDGASYTRAASAIGLLCGDTISHWVQRFNHEGLAALSPRPRPGRVATYSPTDRQRILDEFGRPPDRERDSTATWSIATLQRAVRRAPDGLPRVSGYTVWKVLVEAGYRWGRTRSWCPTGTAKRLRKHLLHLVRDPDSEAKKKAD